MKKFFSLFRAINKQGNNILNCRTKAGESKLKRMVTPVVSRLIMMFIIGMLAAKVAESFYEVGLTWFMLILAIISTSVLMFVQGISGTQAALFDDRDNNVLFSLPIRKSSILAARLMKLLKNQCLFGMLIMLPCIGVYVNLERPQISFYFITLIMLALVPIIPTIISCMITYILKIIISKVRAKKLVQNIVNFSLWGIMFFAGRFIGGNVENIVSNAGIWKERLTKIFYTACIYAELIQKFDTVKFLKWIAINIIPFVIMIYLASIYYFKIIAKLSEGSESIIKRKIIKLKVDSPRKALIKRELSRFFNSPILIFITAFQVSVIVIFAITFICNDFLFDLLVFNLNRVGLGIEDIPKLFVQLMILVGGISSVAAIAISIEGKNFNITKGLPIKTKDIILTKVLANNIIVAPSMLISGVLIAIKCHANFTNWLLMLSFSIVIPTVISMIGIIINLRYPKMDWNEESEMIQRSTSTFISRVIGVIIAITSIKFIYKYITHLKIAIYIELAIFVLLSVALWNILKIYGKKRLREINI